VVYGMSAWLTSRDSSRRVCRPGKKPSQRRMPLQQLPSDPHSHHVPAMKAAAMLQQILAGGSHVLVSQPAEGTVVGTSRQ
jgi:hypothetical protein